MRSALFLIVSAATVCHAAEEVITIPTRDGVKLSYLLVQDPSQSGPCAPQSPHGYFGRDAPVAQAMRNWMLGREFARDIQ